jgi:hypothetical protein
LNRQCRGDQRPNPQHASEAGGYLGTASPELVAAVDVSRIPRKNELVKAVAALLVLLLTSAILAPVTCAGWESSPESRRQCCQRSHHTSCDDQAAVDNCCAANEQGRFATLMGDTAIPHVQAMAMLVPTFDESLLAPNNVVVKFSTAMANRLHGPPDLLVLPLRI